MNRIFQSAWIALLAGAGLCLAQEPLASVPTPSEGVLPTGAPVGGWMPYDPAARFWFDGEYLFWWIKDAPVPVPLVTTGPIVGNLTPVIGQPGTVLLIGDDDLENAQRSGGRFTAGWWFGNDRAVGTEASYFFLGRHSVGEGVSSNAQPGSAFLALPFFDVTAPGESSTRIALPGGFAGTALLGISSSMQGAEWNLAGRLVDTGIWDVALLGGFRYLYLHEHLDFATSSPSIVPPLDVFRTLDQFDTRNNFYGGQIGVRTEYRLASLFAQVAARVAFGSVHQTVNIDGELVTSDFSPVGAVQTFPAGYLALPTNIGRQSQDRFAVLPEVDVNLGWQFARRARLSVGYTFLCVSDVLRPGDQIDRGLNPSQAPAITGIPSVVPIGLARPTPLMDSTGFWAQGLSFGLDFRY